MEKEPKINIFIWAFFFSLFLSFLSLLLFLLSSLSSHLFLSPLSLSPLSTHSFNEEFIFIFLLL